MNRLHAALLIVGAVLLGACVAGLSSCGSRGSAAGQFHDTHPLPADTMTFAVDEVGTYGGRFVIGETTGPKTFNGLIANETSTLDITSRMFVTLADFDNHDQLQTPWLAKSWEVAPDGLTWTFHLRRGAAFSDGHPITSEDVLFSAA